VNACPACLHEFDPGIFRPGFRQRTCPNCRTPLVIETQLVDDNHSRRWPVHTINRESDLRRCSGETGCGCVACVCAYY
jgi:hypothetical protein